MVPPLAGLLHAGPGSAPTLPTYLTRVLLHLVGFAGLAVLVRWVLGVVDTLHPPDGGDVGGGARRGRQ